MVRYLPQTSESRSKEGGSLVTRRSCQSISNVENIRDSDVGRGGGLQDSYLSLGVVSEPQNAKNQSAANSGGALRVLEGLEYYGSNGGFTERFHVPNLSAIPQQCDEECPRGSEWLLVPHAWLSGCGGKGLGSGPFHRSRLQGGRPCRQRSPQPEKSLPAESTQLEHAVWEALEE